MGITKDIRLGCNLLSPTDFLVMSFYTRGLIHLIRQ